MRPYVIQMWEFLMDSCYYGHKDFDANWMPGIVEESIQIMLICWRHFYDSDGTQYLPLLRETLGAHIVAECPPELSALTGRQASLYAKAGIDVASGSPLLLMAHAAAQNAHKQAASASTSALVDTIGEQIKRLREESNLTTEQIADLIGIRPRNVYRHLAGINPRPRQIKAYEEAFTKVLGRQIKLKRQ